MNRGRNKETQREERKEKIKHNQMTSKQFV